jgi:uncharacterized protein YdeI (YjbR/CyaY-like superfamily)
MEAWLADQHAVSPGIWVRIAKKESGLVSVGYAEAVEVAICYGWIDGLKDKLDENYWLQRFTPRRAGSRWSKINTQKAAALIDAGRMQPAGLREVELAKADGRWDAAYPGRRSITVPDDLARELAANPAARACFETASSATRFAIVYRVNDARRPETRAKRIAHYIAMLSAGKPPLP